MIQPLQSVLFDLDGTLLDSAAGITASMVHAFEVMNRPFDITQAWRYIGPPLMAMFNAEFPDDQDAANRMAEVYRAHHRQTGMALIVPFEGIPQLLRDLRGEGKRMLVVTSRMKPMACELLEKHELLGYFEAVWGAPPGAVYESKAQLIRDAAGAHALDINACVMVGDRRFDIDGAREAGMRSIAVGYGNGTPEEFALAKPTFIAEDVAALRALLLADA